MLPNKIQNRIFDINRSIIEALQLMDKENIKLLFIYAEGKFKCILSIGDIQRAVIKNVVLDSPVATILRSHYTFSRESDDRSEIKKIMISQRIECMPILNKNNDLIDAIFWEDIIDAKNINPDIGLPVVIMAGGKGTRLQPLTNIFPKPLIPIGDKTIIETIMDKFITYKCNNFYISVNYKANVIKNYFDVLNNSQYNINYFQENKPMGTAGSLRLLKDKLHTTFFVSNCDILIKEDYANILTYHKNNCNELTVVAALKTYSIPYGTINTGENGILESLEEKPSLTFKINTGLYILEPSVLNEIPDDFFHITHLIEKLRKEKRRVGVYPISQNDWIDMGDWNEYLAVIKK